MCGPPRSARHDAAVKDELDNESVHHFEEEWEHNRITSKGRSGVVLDRDLEEVWNTTESRLGGALLEFPHTGHG